MTARHLRQLARTCLVVCLLGAGAAVPALAADGLHGISAFGKLKYGPGFEHFDYVNPDAPKGGELSMIGTAGLTTFNSLNAFILKGDAAQGLEYLFDSLMVRAFDEPDAVYGLVAKTVDVPDDHASATFHMRPEAKFADGSPVTAADVVFSFDTLRKDGHPQYRLQLRDVTKAEALDGHTVRYTFTGERKRDLPQIVAQLPILSKAYYTSRDFTQTTLEPPLGSGPYKVASVRQGRSISYTRRDDYWGKGLAVNAGRFNFDTLTYEYFRDRTAEFEALKAGVYDLREEFTSKSWATEYDIPQVRSGRLKKETIPDDRPSGTQGFFINTRKDRFADPRVREALDYAFDFKWTNRNQFYGLYERTTSYFENSPLAASGKPSPAELKLLAPFRDALPEAVFADAYTPPVSDGSGQDRRLLRKARHLLREAGWKVERGRCVNARGEQMKIEFLMNAPTFERVIAPYIRNLELLGIDARMRLVDPSQYESRIKTFDFDVVTQRYVMSPTPGTEVRAFWGSEAAKMSGSYNLAGIHDPAVDALIDDLMAAANREELTTAAHALDRVLRTGHYWVSHWYKAEHDLAYWDKFSRPATKPKYERGVIDTWWFDADKAAKLAQSR